MKAPVLRLIDPKGGWPFPEETFFVDSFLGNVVEKDFLYGFEFTEDPIYLFWCAVREGISSDSLRTKFNLASSLEP